MSVSRSIGLFPVQLQQALTLIVLVALARGYAYGYLDPWRIGMLLLIAVVAEHVLLFVREGRIGYFSYSALSTALGVVLMMAAPHLWIYGVVIVLALIQKHFLVYRGRHFFNPSNFALMAAMVLFYRQAHVVLGQMGDALWLEATVLFLALAVLVRVDRWVIPVVFAVTYAGAAYLWIVGYDPVVTFEDIYERFESVSFAVFTVFMLTDPRTTPSVWWQQIIFGAVIALVAVGLDRWDGLRVQHVFMALFALSPWVVWLEASARERKGALKRSVLLFLLAVGAIIMIEIQPPYYYEMDG
jgi:hypothetical protein